MAINKMLESTKEFHGLPFYADADKRSHGFIDVFTSLTGYLKMDALFEAYSSPDGVYKEVLPESLKIKKLGADKKYTMVQMMTGINGVHVYTTEKRALQCECIMNAQSEAPFENKEDELHSGLPTSSLLVSFEEPHYVKHKQLLKLILAPVTAEIVPSTDEHGIKKAQKRKQSTPAKVMPKKRMITPRMKTPQSNRRSAVRNAYSPKTSIRIYKDICGEIPCPFDLQSLKQRKLTVKTARGKPNDDFGIFCEASWFRKQLSTGHRDHSIPLPDEPLVVFDAKENKKKRFDPFTKERAAQFNYAPIPIPENFTVHPAVPTFYGDVQLKTDAFMKLDEEHKKLLENAHLEDLPKEEFHWKDYLQNALLTKNEGLRNLYERFDQGFSIATKFTIL